MEFIYLCPEISAAFWFLWLYITNQTAKQQTAYMWITLSSSKPILRALTMYLTKIDAELSYDDDNHLLNDFKALAEYIKSHNRRICKRARAGTRKHIYLEKEDAGDFYCMLIAMLNAWFDEDDNKSIEDWYKRMPYKHQYAFIAFTECLDSLSALITKPGRNRRAIYQPGSGNWCVLDSRDAHKTFARHFRPQCNAASLNRRKK